MFKYPYTKNKIKTDIVFVGIFVLLLFIFYKGASEAVQFEVGKLFAVTFTFFSLGIFFIYLTREINPQFSSLLHASLLPLSGTAFLISKWFPKIKTITNNPTIIYGETLTYLIVIMLYFISHLYLHKEETKPGDIKKTRDMPAIE